MTGAAEVLAELRALRFQVRPKGDRLHLSGPVQALTPELKARVLEAKSDLLRMLAGPALNQGLAIRELLDFPAVLLPGLPLATTLVVDLPNGRRLKWATHAECRRADRSVQEWHALCAPDRRRTVREVLAGLCAVLRLVLIEGEGEANP